MTLKEKLDEYPFHYVLTEEEEKMIPEIVQHEDGSCTIGQSTHISSDLEKLIRRAVFAAEGISFDLEDKIDLSKSYFSPMEIVCERCFRRKDFYRIAGIHHYLYVV